ncbi:hypothetical protein SeMB42_g04931 [Synchytrium endobioticum]|uniref:RING-type domain-containing protein n=1 Tax=Synchytrium endobioticum TaxID=286115 RepID=A0A507CV01_9FUNG|nr:hypothetical protein SeMB42_g04931 [Synchytrium endobioticum]TPX46065.1 hypothetical protein SeLEV6574_g03442 [Synchytrium endobioticum]
MSHHRGQGRNVEGASKPDTVFPASATVHGGEQGPPMDILREIFPDLPEALLQSQLDAHANAEDAVNALFAGNQAPIKSPRQPPAGIVSPDPSFRLPRNHNAPSTNSENAHQVLQPVPVSQEPVKFLSEMWPDADEEWLESVLKKCGGALDAATEAIANDNNRYPKRSASKRKRDNDDDEGVAASRRNEMLRRTNYWDVDDSFQPSKEYQSACRIQLRTDFPNELFKDIDVALKQHNHQYTPTFQYLASNQQNARRKPSTRDRKQKRKQTDQIFEEELEWLLFQQTALSRTVDVVCNEGGVDCQVDCGCCYTECSMSQMTQCAEAHLFCMDCARRYVEGRIGDRLCEMKCMDSGGCSASFPDSELRRFLPTNSYQGYEKLIAEETLRGADIDGLVKCPFCDFAVVMERHADEDSLFHCQNKAGRSPCGIISCRKCEKPNHLPKTCKEAKSDNDLDASHVIEERMTEALLHGCPRCKRKSFKEEGCNKMTCVCGNTFCYVCGASPINYNHFDRSGAMGEVKGKCPLHDDTATRNAENVKRAAEQALQPAKLVRHTTPPCPLV